jgi:hypothetical protein
MPLVVFLIAMLLAVLIRTFILWSILTILGWYFPIPEISLFHTALLAMLISALVHSSSESESK